MIRSEADLLKKLGNRWWRLKHLYAVRPEKGGIAKFRPNPAQLFMWKHLWWVMYILKNRQQGVSTGWMIFFLDAVLFEPGKIAGVIDITDKKARQKLAMAKLAYDHMDNAEVHPEVIAEIGGEKFHTWQLGKDLKKEVKLKKGGEAEFPEELVFSNKSSMWAAVNFRGSTLQYGLFTEFGKIAKDDPGKAREIVDGAENGMHEGSLAVYETTHEGGRSGLAYERCQMARMGPQDNKEMTRLDAKFIFIPWYTDPRNRMSEQAGANLRARMDQSVVFDTRDGPWDAGKYFRKAEAAGVGLSWEQKAWYVGKKRSQGHSMLKEHPTFPDEPFDAPIDGAIYAPLIVRAREDGRIGQVPYNATYPVWTFWDLGAPENTVVWYLQEAGEVPRVLRCDYGVDGIAGDQTADRVAHMNGLGYAYAGHVLPHDGLHKQKGGRTFRRELEDAGLKNVIGLERTKDKQLRINGLKGLLSMMMFDAEKCEKGILALEHNHRKPDPRDPKHFLDEPEKDWSLHGCDSLGYYWEARMKNILSSPMVYGHGGAGVRAHAGVPESDMDAGLLTWGRPGGPRHGQNIRDLVMRTW